MCDLHRLPPLSQVTPQGDAYFCEFDGKTYERMERRYVLLVKASDATGEAYLNMFNEQVMHLLLLTAQRHGPTLNVQLTGNAKGGRAATIKLVHALYPAICTLSWLTFFCRQLCTTERLLWKQAATDRIMLHYCVQQDIRACLRVPHTDAAALRRPLSCWACPRMRWRS